MPNLQLENFDQSEASIVVMCWAFDVAQKAGKNEHHNKIYVLPRRISIRKIELTMTLDTRHQPRVSENLLIIALFLCQ